MVKITRKRSDEEKARLAELASRGVQGTFPSRIETREAIQGVRVQRVEESRSSRYSQTPPSALQVRTVDDRRSSTSLAQPQVQQPAPAPAPAPAAAVPTEHVSGNGVMKARVRPATPEDLAPGASGPPPSLEEDIREATQLTEFPQAPSVDLGVVLGQREERGIGTIQSLFASSVWPKVVVWMGHSVDGPWPGVDVQRMPMPPTPWSRFVYAAHMLSTEYVLIIDDDAAPAPGWVEAAIKHVEANPNDIVSVSGLVRGNGDYELEVVVGPGAEPSETQIVIVGTQGWLLKRSRLAEMMSKIDVRSAPSDLGWNFHLSLSNEGGNTVVLPYTKETAGTTATPAKDERSLSNAPDYAKRRDAFEDRYMSTKDK